MTKTLTASSTALLSTNTTTNGPALSDTAMVTPDPPFVSNETTAIYIHQNIFNSSNDTQYYSIFSQVWLALSLGHLLYLLTIIKGDHVTKPIILVKI